MDLRMDKSAAIRSAIALLSERFGSRSFEVVDWWPDDPDQIGIARPGAEEPVVCIMTAGKSDGRFDVEHHGKIYRDCVAEGLCWAVGGAISRLASTRAPAALDRREMR
jgi:hypothetical protein